MEFEIVDRRGGNKEVVAEPAADERLEAAVENAKRTGSYDITNDDRAKGQPAPLEFKKTARGEAHKWKGPVSFLMVSMPMNQGQVFLCRAVGMRSDDRVFQADYAIPPIWSRAEDFTSAAEQRLGTFLACSCERKGPCKFHGEALPGAAGMGKWLEDDVKRLQRVQATPLPEAVEVLMRAEAERANSRIVVPGR